MNDAQAEHARSMRGKDMISQILAAEGVNTVRLSPWRHFLNRLISRGTGIGSSRTYKTALKRALEAEKCAVIQVNVDSNKHLMFPEG